MEQQKRKGILYEAALLLVGLIWGGGFIATRIAVDVNLSASLILAGRFFIAALVFGCAFWKTILKNINLRSIIYGGIVGGLLFFGFTTQTIAMGSTTPSNAGFLTATNVVIVPFLWWIVAKKRPPTRLIVACLICCAGIGVLSLKLDGFVFTSGDWLAFICAFFFAAHIVFTGIFSTRVDAKVLVFTQFATAAILSLLSFLIFDRNYQPLLTFDGFLSVAYLGVFSTCLCFFLQAVAQIHVAASKAALFLCTESLFCSVFSVMMGYEPVTASLLIGGAMILSSVVLAEYNPQKKCEKPSLQVTAANED